MKHYLNHSIIIFFSISVVFVYFSCTKAINQNAIPIYEEIMKSMKSSGELSSVFNLNLVQVQDLSNSDIKVIYCR
jgi:hypothetical protein